MQPIALSAYRCLIGSEMLISKSKIFFILFVILIFINSCTCKSTKVFISTPQGSFSKSVKSMQDLRYQNIVKQEYDFSCGAGSLATLLTYYFNENISEKEIIETIFKDMKEKEVIEIIKEGFSMLNLKQAAEKLGYTAKGYRLKIHRLDKLSLPVIVFLSTKDLKHFTLFKGIRKDRVYLADPTRGNIRVDLKRFHKQWQDGFTLVVYKPSGKLPEYPGIKIEDTMFIRPELLSIRDMGIIR